MSTYTIFLSEAGIIAAGLAGLLCLYIIRRRNTTTLKTDETPLNDEELYEHARKTAIEHAVSGEKSTHVWPVPAMNDNYAFITQVYKNLNDDATNKRTIPPAAEWLLDNFYLIEEQVKILRIGITKEECLRLPMLKHGLLKGHSRSYAVARELVGHTDGRLDEGMIISYLKAYQSHSVLASRELWIMPAMIMFALIERIRNICDKIRNSQLEWQKAEILSQSFLGSNAQDFEKIMKEVALKSEASDSSVNSSFIEHLCYRLRKEGNVSILKYIDGFLKKHGTTLEELTGKEHNLQAGAAVSMGNCITGLKYISSMDWTEVFNSVSHVEDILSNDPDGTYPLMDMDSKNFYRKRIEELSLEFGVSELHTAKTAIELASSSDATEELHKKNEVSSHVGYYIAGKGVTDLKSRLGEGKKANSNTVRPWALYFGSSSSIFIIIIALCAGYAFYSSGRILPAVFAGLLALLPSSEIAVLASNKLSCKLVKPSCFVRLEFKNGIPDNYKTIVVIPALLTDEKRVHELLENLETHYLAGRDKNLFFALLGDFRDSDTESQEEDSKITNAGLLGIKRLNEKYSKDGRDIFYYLHRKRKFNERHQKWMGWERKRGALLEFNDVLIGKAMPDFVYISGKIPEGIKYVITLDADTILPIGTAKKLVGTMAHPLYRPIIDNAKNTVKDGYGIMQPRVSVDIASANKTLFSRIMSGQEGIDPYSCAISDVYQDLFYEGIFTGKGIYDLEVFQAVLRNAFPENAVLSHDLLEGSYLRCGLVTDTELVDSCPAKYNSYAARMHRWVRGDWQLIPWLFDFVKNAKGKSVINPLSGLSKWKIFDNIRRSLIAPSLILLLIFSAILPGSAFFWLLLFFAVPGFPLLMSFIDLAFSKKQGIRTKRHMRAITGIKAGFYQFLLTVVFMPYHAILDASAAIVTLYRVLISKKNTLVWVTAADTEKTYSNSLTGYVNKMKGVLAVSLLIALEASLVKKAFEMPVFLIIAMVFLFSPAIAWYVSRFRNEKNILDASDISELRLIARKTWRYFEEFTNYKNNYLIPDNYQEEPYRGVAPRTSPTNIGLSLLAVLSARDFGYISTLEMTHSMEQIFDSIEKLEKWNGHLYNWYDTKTLRPLRPRYVSTVDSGNLACYLITLSQGLSEYLKRPPIEGVLLDGLNDTLSLAGIDISDIDKAKALWGNKSAGPLEWKKLLDKLIRCYEMPDAKKSPWRIKAAKTLEMFSTELDVIFPWINSYKDMESSNDASGEGYTMHFAGLLEDTVSLEELPGYYKEILSQLKENSNRIGSENSDLAAYDLEDNIKNAIEAQEGLIRRIKALISKSDSLVSTMSFLPLFVEKKNLFSIGFNVEEGRLTNSFYDLLASEARQTSYLAIARGEVPVKHWFRMGRALTVVEGYKGLVSWTGTMFEYLMPLLLMRSYRNTLLDETYSFVIRSQKKYSYQRRMPWGASESGFYSLDVNHDYQYKAIGVPWLGLKRGLIEDAVATPYATMLALMVDPKSSMENIRLLRSEGLDGPYGFYEAVDYTRERLPFGMKKAVVKSFMAHHQGMSFLSLNNCINGFIMQQRFHNDPQMKAAQLLLEEKVPMNIVFTKEQKEKVVPFRDVVYKERGPVRKIRKPDSSIPAVHMLTNGSYSVMITDRGTGFSKCRKIEVNRWREDNSLDNYGMFFYIRNVDSGEVWSSTLAPLYRMPQKYEAVFTTDKASFKRSDGDIDTHTEIVVATGENAEIRKLSFKNNGTKPCVLEITSYFEAVIAPHAADVAHPSFSNLFVKTGYINDKKCITAHRRGRSEHEKSVYLASTIALEGKEIGEIQYETDRMSFTGRGRTLRSPSSMERNKPLSNSTGSVLDPVICLRLRVAIEPSGTSKVAFITSVGENLEAAVETAIKYQDFSIVEMAFRTALTRSQIEARYLGLKASETELYSEMLSDIFYYSPQKRIFSDITSKNIKGQSSLWAFGISGDLPIVLAIIKRADDLDVIHNLLKAHEYWRIKDVRVDLVVLDDEENSYTHPLKALLEELVRDSHSNEFNRSGGVFVLKRSSLSEEDTALLFSVARLVVFGDKGKLIEQIRYKKHDKLPPIKNFTTASREYPMPSSPKEELLYFNGIGGFSADGREYVIKLDKDNNTPLPWSNIISNEDFGFLTTESGGGYTWSENSRENKLSPWSNDPVSDTRGELLYIQDSVTGEMWGVTPIPLRESTPYTIRHGFGYSSFLHDSHGIKQELTQFIPENEHIKLSLLKLQNVSDIDRKLTVTFYMRPVLGVSDQITAMHVKTSVDETGVMLIENAYNEEFSGRIAFLDCSLKERSITGDRQEFFGLGGIERPEALLRESLSNFTGTGVDPCAAIQVNIELKSKSHTEVVFLLGEGRNINDIRGVCGRYRNFNTASAALQNIRNVWHKRLGMLSVDTPDTSMNLLLNGWLIYQTIACRIFARSAFYQSGGAFGFRDQLQDCLAVVKTQPDLVKRQILLHAAHQFIEGDVQHWWHEPSGKGTRTKFSDDLLWLPYAVCEYINVTGDIKILDKKVGFVEDEELGEFEDERYSIPVASEVSATIFDHCIKALERSLKFGSHGLPLMGSGDWNDGMNQVGPRGKGESVWLGWFIIKVLDGFSSICEKISENERAAMYRETIRKITSAIEENAWDGSWYRRAYFDNGIPLGSSINTECRIDSISQTWGVISGAANLKRVREAMDSVENYLVDRDSALIKLLTPPFDEGDLEPGYIKGYVPGVRENGGQYTHAAAWVIIAFAMLGEGEKAHRLFQLINPINHTRTQIEYSRYKVEPYVMAADVYAVGEHAGRGGWTWYTGSSGWMYRAGIESILGFSISNGHIAVNPCIPGSWTEFSIKYNYNETHYEIKVSNPEGVEKGVVKVSMDGKELKDGLIPLLEDGKVHKVTVLMGHKKIKSKTNPSQKSFDVLHA